MGPITKAEDRALTAMILWEDHMENLNNTGHPITRYREENGASEARRAAWASVAIIEAVWALLPEDYCDGNCFDWEFVPDFMMFCGRNDLNPWEFTKKDATSLALSFLATTGRKDNR